MREKIKILILDESKEDIKKISELLIENGYTYPIFSPDSEQSFLKSLKENAPDVIICEHEIKTYNSLNAVNNARKILPNIIFIIVSNQITDEFGLELLKEGVDIYFLKDRLFKLPTVIEKLYIGRHIQEEIDKLSAANSELEKAYREIEIKNENIIQSIVFAKRIQSLTLPKIDLLLRNFSEAFILYRPKDIVSGDFYWFRGANGSGKFMVAVGDCTGHGVSAALLSMIGYNLLNDIVGDDNFLTDPTDIISELDGSMVKLLKQDTSLSTGYQDGIDMSFVTIDKNEKKIHFCGCKRPLLYLVRNEKKITVYKGESYLVGGMDERITKTFKTQEIDYQDGDIIYMLTDGYTDQFGGDDNKKLMKDKFIEILESIQHLNLHYQSQLLEQKLVKWQGCNEQTDDILVVGIKL